MADADLLPFEFGDFAETMQTYVRELKKLSKKMQDDIRERNREIDEGVFTAVADPKKPYIVPPKKEEVPPYQNFAPLENAADAVTRSAEQYHKALEHANANGGAALAAASLNEVNRLLVESERKLITQDGLPNRKWYRHATLRARLLYWICCQDNAVCAGSDRAEGMETGRPRGRGRGALPAG